MREEVAVCWSLQEPAYELELSSRTMSRSGLNYFIKKKKRSIYLFERETVWVRPRTVA